MTRAILSKLETVLRRRLTLGDKVPSARLAAASLFVMAVVPLTGSSCSDDGFGRARGTQRLVVEFVDPEVDVGTRFAGLPLPLDKTRDFEVRVRALRPDGTIDTTFNRYVRVASKPGAVAPLDGDGTEGRNVLLRGGISEPVTVKLANVFGVTYILAQDAGYVPVDPLRDPPPACSDGKDNDGDGTIDFPADEGCAFANDDAEEGGTYAEGASPPIFFVLPRVSDTRGLACPDRTNPNACTGGGATPYGKQAINLDTGYHEFLAEDDSRAFKFDFSLVVTRLSSSGFYVSDLREDTPTFLPKGYNNLYIFNFSTPPEMKVCDRLKTFAGTPSEFYGFTQLSFPTWTIEPWDPSQRRCLVPEPSPLTNEDIAGGANTLQPLTGGLVRLETLLNTDGKPVRSAMVTPKFGRGEVPCVDENGDVTPIAELANGVKGCAVKTNTDGTRSLQFVPGPDATNCDFDKNGSITFRDRSCVPCDAEGADPATCDGGGCVFPEDDCSQTCSGDAECTEYSNFASRSTFRITVADINGLKSAIQANGTAAGFDPLANKGQLLRSFTGALTFFSGGAQYTIEARCDDDVVMDPAGAPVASDVVCANSSECPSGFECLPLGDGSKACRSAQEGSRALVAPHLACVFPRTFADDNPQ